MTQLPGTFHQLHHEAIPQELTVLLMETTMLTYNPELGPGYCEVCLLGKYVK